MALNAAFFGITDRLLSDQTNLPVAPNCSELPTRKTPPFNTNTRPSYHQAHDIPVYCAIEVIN